MNNIQDSIAQIREAYCFKDSNERFLLVSSRRLSGINPSADAKMYLTLPSMDGYERRVMSIQQQQ